MTYFPYTLLPPTLPLLSLLHTLPLLPPPPPLTTTSPPPQAATHSSLTTLNKPPSSPRDASGEDWQQTADSSVIVEDDLRELYQAALEECKFDSAELEDVHTLSEKAQEALDPRSPMVRAVLRDMKQLQEASVVHPDSAIFIRQVGENGAVSKACILVEKKLFLSFIMFQ